MNRTPPDLTTKSFWIIGFANQNDLERPVQCPSAPLPSQLGLSVTTVSRALGGFPEVSAATRARVLAEAARIGYRPNQIARRLRHGRSEAIGLVLPAEPGQFDDPFFLRFWLPSVHHCSMPGSTCW